MEMTGSRPKFNSELYSSPFKIKSVECVNVNANYTDLPELEQYVCISHFEDNDPLGDSPEIGLELIDSFYKGLHCHGGNDPLPMDRNHDSLFGADSREYSFITDLKALPENTDGTCALKLYDSTGQAVARRPLGSNGFYLMGKLAIPTSNLELIAQGQIGTKFSICFTYERPQYLLNVAWCQLPAKEGVPSFIAESAGGTSEGRRNLRFRFLSDFDFKSINQEILTRTYMSLDKKTFVIERKEKDMQDKKTESKKDDALKRVTDETLATNLKDALLSGGVSETGSTAIVNAVDDVDGAALLAICQKAAGTTTTGEGENKDSTDATPTDPPQPTPIQQSKEFQALSKRFDELEKRNAQLERFVNPKTDPIYKAAFDESLKVKGVLEHKADKIARDAQSICSSEDSAKLFARHELANYKPPTTGSQSETVDEDLIDSETSLIERAKSDVERKLNGRSVDEQTKQTLVSKRLAELRKTSNVNFDERKE